MPAKHAPKSSLSFYLSLGRAAVGTLGAVGIVVVLALVAFGGGGGGGGGGDGDKRPDAGPVLSTPAPSPSASPSASPSPSLRPRTQVRVAVLNGTFRSGLAGKISRQATARGWKVADVGNNGTLIPASTIFYKPGFLAEAQTLLKQFPGFTKLEPAPSRYENDVTLVPGSDYPK